MEEHSYVVSPRPLRPKSPQSPHSLPPHSPKGPRSQPRGEENSAPKSPKTGLTEPKSSRPSAAKVMTSGSRRTDQSSVSKRGKGPDESSPPDTKIKTYFNQSDLIKPVSVKLENCLLSKSLLDGATPMKKLWVNLTLYEVKGLSQIIQWLDRLPANKKSVPKDILQPDALLKDAMVSKDL